MLIEDLTEKKVIITGANSGIGLQAARILSNLGAHVILAVRDQQKGSEAVHSILKKNKTAMVEVIRLDLSDLKSVSEFVKEYSARYDSLDILINNAGVMVPPYGKTKDGFEMQFGINHLGHFALTGLLLPLLKKTDDARVVTLSSIAHRNASIMFDNLDGSQGYSPMKFYRQSKLANLLFAKELDQRLKEHDLSVLSIACHPGITSTNLFKIGKKDSPAMIKKLLEWFFQSVEMGVLPTIYAATEERLEGGEYIGPDGRGNRTGNPTIETPAAGVYNKETMKKLWDVSESLTGVVYNFSKST